jgi:TPR repeat protein
MESVVYRSRGRAGRTARMIWRRWWIVPAVVAATFAALQSFLSMQRRVLTPTTHVVPAHTSSSITKVTSEVGGKGSRKVAQGLPQTPPEVSWTTKYRAAVDYFAFVSEAIPAALKGDGRAAYYIGTVLETCALVIHDYRDSTDPEAQLNGELMKYPKAPQWTKDLQAQRVHQCVGLANHDAFAGLPAGQTYNSSYWYDAAVSDGDPLAQVHLAWTMALDIAVSESMPPDIKAKKIQSAEVNLKAAITSGDANAMFNVGMAIAGSNRIFGDPTQGLAIALAACELGYDCSADNPENDFSNCKLSGTCPAEATLAYYLQQSLGGEKYAQLYARAQAIKQLEEDGDWAAVAKNVEIGERSE